MLCLALVSLGWALGFLVWMEELNCKLVGSDFGNGLSTIDEIILTVCLSSYGPSLLDHNPDGGQDFRLIIEF